MALSELQLNNIITRTRENIALMNTSTKRKFERLQFESWVEEFSNLDSAEVITFIEELYNQQFVSLENACLSNYDYIALTGLGNLVTNQARQEILQIVANGGTTHKEDIKDIMDRYIESKEANNRIVELDLILSFNEKTSSQR